MVDMQARSVRGSVAFITGVASGMGAATAKLFAAAGAHVAAVDRDAAGLDAVLAEIAAAGGSAHGWVTDIGDQAAVNATVAAAAAHFGGLDIIVNNAGIAGFSPIDAEGYDDLWERILRINLSAHQWVVRAALPWLRQSKAPRIVNIASTEALGATAYDSAYVAAKAGVTGLTRALAVDLGPEGITCNCICPGPIDTGMTANVEADKKLIFAKRRTALKRYGAPIEVAQMTLSLCLPAASYITGAVIPVDGGLVARNA